MIEYVDGNIFASIAQVLVNPVNCVGKMGKGLVWAFARRYSVILEPYEAWCRNGKLVPGTVLPVPVGDRWIINLPTKRHYRNALTLDDIRSGVVELRRWLEKRGLVTVAIPALGCGEGGLEFRDVMAVIDEELAGFAGRVTVYRPY